MPNQNNECGVYFDLSRQSGSIKNIFIHAADDESEQVVLNSLRKYFRPDFLYSFRKLFGRDSE
jgi:hypothetical protein